MLAPSDTAPIAVGNGGYLAPLGGKAWRLGTDLQNALGDHATDLPSAIGGHGHVMRTIDALRSRESACSQAAAACAARGPHVPGGGNSEPSIDIKPGGMRRGARRSLVHDLRRRRGGGYRPGTLCIGVGEGIAMAVEPAVPRHRFAELDWR
jgi:hypothetical protein